MCEDLIPNIYVVRKTEKNLTVLYLKYIPFSFHIALNEFRPIMAIMTIKKCVCKNYRFKVYNRLLRGRLYALLISTFKIINSNIQYFLLTFNITLMCTNNLLYVPFKSPWVSVLRQPVPGTKTRTKYNLVKT